MAGHLAEHKVSLVGTDTLVTIKVLLGLGEWDALEQLFYDGSIIIDPTKYTFHPGTLSTGVADTVQGVDPRFPSSICHNLVAYYTADLPVGLASADRPDLFRVIVRTLKVNDYDSTGTVTGYSYSPNPARVFVDAVRRAFLTAGLSNAYFISRIDWAAFVHARDYYNVTLNTSDTYKTPKNFGALAASGGSLSAGSYTVSAIMGDGTGWSARTSEVPLTVSASGKIVASMSPPDTTWAITTYKWFVKFGGVYYASTTGTPTLDLGVLGSVETPPAAATGVFLITAPRFESHIAFTGAVKLPDALNSIMYQCCSDWQDVDGKLRIMTPELRSSIANVTLDNTLPDSFEFSRRSAASSYNRYEGTGRDLLDPYLREFKPPVSVDRTDVQAKVGVVKASVPLGSMTKNQAARVLNFQIRGESDLPDVVNVAITGALAHVMPGDVLTVDEVSKDFLVVNRDDDDSTTADTGTLGLKEYQVTYSDDDIAPLTTTSPTDIPSKYLAPPVITSLTLTEIASELPGGSVDIGIRGDVQFAASSSQQRGRLFWKKVGSGSFLATNILLIPEPVTGLAAFELVGGIYLGAHHFKVITESVLNVTSTGTPVDHSITITGDAARSRQVSDAVFILDGVGDLRGKFIGHPRLGESPTYVVEVWDNADIGTDSEDHMKGTLPVIAGNDDHTVVLNVAGGSSGYVGNPPDDDGGVGFSSLATAYAGGNNLFCGAGDEGNPHGYPISGVSVESLDASDQRVEFTFQSLNSNAYVGSSMTCVAGLQIRADADPVSDVFTPNLSQCPISISFSPGTIEGTVKETYKSFGATQKVRDNIDPGFSADGITPNRVGPRYTFQVTGSQYRIFSGAEPAAQVIIATGPDGPEYPLRWTGSASAHDGGSVGFKDITSGGNFLATTFSVADQIAKLGAQIDFSTEHAYLRLFQKSETSNVPNGIPLDAIVPPL